MNELQRDAAAQMESIPSASGTAGSEPVARKVSTAPASPRDAAATRPSSAEEPGPGTEAEAEAGT